MSEGFLGTGWRYELLGCEQPGIRLDAATGGSPKRADEL